jgi:hypothetical protein
MTRAENFQQDEQPHLRRTMELMLSLYEIDPAMQLSEILVFLHVAEPQGYRPRGPNLNSP